jgi:hypothetical protein
MHETKRREYWVYDGQTVIGHFIVDDKTGTAKAFNAAGRMLGNFSGYDTARKAVNDAYSDAQARKAATAKALEYINRPDIEFASGLPVDLVGGERRR